VGHSCYNIWGVHKGKKEQAKFSHIKYEMFSIEEGIDTKYVWMLSNYIKWI